MAGVLWRCPSERFGGKMKTAKCICLGALFIFLNAVVREGLGKSDFIAGAQEAPQSRSSNKKDAIDKSATGASSTKSKADIKFIDWTGLLSSIRIVLKQTSPYGEREAQNRIGIVEERDITGDGVPEALVYTGEGGASTDILVLMRIEDGKPVLARFKNAEGKLTTLEFLKGASVMHGDSTVMLPDEKAIYLGEYFMNSTATGFSSCTAKAYRWNERTKTFDWDRNLGKQIAETFCKNEKEVLIPK
jgi:hypothetical protein